MGPQKIGSSSDPHSPQLHRSVQHTRSTPFQPQKTFFQYKKGFNTTFTFTYSSVELKDVLNWGLFWTEGCRTELFLLMNWRFLVLNCVVCWTERCVELEGFWCWIDGFWLLKRLFNSNKRPQILIIFTKQYTLSSFSSYDNKAVHMFRHLG